MVVHKKQNHFSSNPNHIQAKVDYNDRTKIDLNIEMEQEIKQLQKNQLNRINTVYTTKTFRNTPFKM